MTRRPRPARRHARRAVFWILALGVALFAIQGGEYSTSDLIGQHFRAARLRAVIDSLEQNVDSLQRLEKAIRTDPAMQERIAREEFGMVRGDKELLYRFADPPDSIAAPLPRQAPPPRAGRGGLRPGAGR